MSIIIGIDPGLTGAIAKVGSGGLMDLRDIPTVPRSAGVVKHQIDGHGLIQIFRELTSGHDKNEFFVFLEKVAANPKNGICAIFSLGMSSGTIETALIACGLPYDFLPPQVWKRHFKLNKDKDAARALAQRYYPDASLARVKDHNRGEALLIARYGWELRG